MKKTGIWMDKEKAHIVRLEENGETFETLYSEMEFFNIKGGSRTRNTKWGPQDVVQDGKYLEREKHQLRQYFQKVSDGVQNADELTLYGPEDTAEKFHKYLDEQSQILAGKVRSVTKADSMTDNQVKALVKDFFRRK